MADPNVRTVRCDRTCYPEGAKPSYDEVLREAAKGSVWMSERQYQASDNKDLKPSTTTTFFNAEGKIVAASSDVYSDYSTCPHYRILHTPEADYADWDCDGLIDSKDTDKEVPVLDITTPTKYITTPTKYITTPKYETKPKDKTMPEDKTTPEELINPLVGETFSFEA